MSLIFKAHQFFIAKSASSLVLAKATRSFLINKGQMVSCSRNVLKSLHELIARSLRWPRKYVAQVQPPRLSLYSSQLPLREEF